MQVRAFSHARQSLQTTRTSDYCVRNNLEERMALWKSLALSTLTAGLLSGVTLSPAAPAQVSVGVNIGAAPVCPYGYFDYAPYDCAPYGYYGPDWFVGGVFLG